MAYTRQRTYHDLSAEEKVRYDLLRKQAKLAPYKSAERERLQAEANAMLGLSFFSDFTGPASINREPHDPGRRQAGTSRDPGHGTFG